MKDTNASTYKGDAKLLIGIILAVLSFWLFAQSVLNMEPAIQKSLGMTSGAMGIGVSITALFSGLFIVLTGGLADRLGRVKFSLAGLVINIIGSILLIIAQSAPLFIAGRILQGVAAAFIMPATMALVKTYYDGAERQRAVSYWSIGSWGGSGLCSFFGGAIASTLGWRYVFIFSIIVSVISFILIMGTPESKVVVEKVKFDFFGLILFIISMLALNLGISSAQQYGLQSSRTLTLFAVVIVGLVLFYFTKKNKSNSFMDFNLFKNRFYLGATISNFLLNAVAGTLIVINTYMQIGRGLSSAVAGEMSLGYLVCILITIRIGEKLLQKMGARKPMVLGASATLIGIILMTFVNVQGPLYLVLVFIGYSIFGIGLGIYATPSTDTAISNVSDEKVGSASGIYKMASSLGGAIGVAISLAVFSSVGADKVSTAAFLGLGVNIIFGILAIISIMFIIPKNSKMK
ncbi:MULTISPECIES: MFS transporter [unclassified Lactococcus]|uniref:MFS transporter n=1 Tax=unclassified Lactococcus TaxID=2643510 RepID=UPI0011CC3B35|nr:MULTISPECIES: MFS transporter [unclassified Lactococcus]MQW23244.1 MFS transporter [Lactococcus sp. dk101]TXK38127.1 MFS transporter [Lactococcus sp. dk310]TXK49805.1 MFS transporter [Lactococcus sp. dk322]